MLLFLMVMVAAAMVAEADDVKTARLSQMVVFSVCTMFFGGAWTNLFGARAASQKVPPGTNLFTTGFKKLSKTVIKIFSQNAAMKWFLVAVAFAESAVASFNTVAITYMTEQLQLTASQNGLAILILLFSSIPGSLLSIFVTNKWNAIRSYQMALAIWIVNTSAAAVVLNGPGKQMEAYFFAVGWGVAMGWIFPTERVAITQMIRKGEEAEIMGVYLCFASLITWLPPLVFTAMNEAGVEMRVSFASLNLFFFISFCLLFLMGNFDDVVQKAKSESINDSGSDASSDPAMIDTGMIELGAVERQGSKSSLHVT